MLTFNRYIIFGVFCLARLSLQQQSGLPNDPVPFPGSTYAGADSPDPAAQLNANFSPPSYPSPWATGNGAWQTAHGKARAFLSQLTLLEKVNLTSGVGWQNERCVGQTGSVPRLGFRSLCLQDSPTGVRSTDFNSVFPAGVNIAATFDRGLAYSQGAAMGAEHRAKGVDVQLGPVAGPLGRNPAGGRNWEGYSPDPVLTGTMMAQAIKGIQSSGVIACAKHFIGNEQEHYRQAQESSLYGISINDSISSNIDDKTMHELYLWPFADAVRAGVGSIMCAYNQVNNSYSCQNSHLLNYLLKGELDFQGFVVSDWGAQHSGVSSALAGLDMTMPGDSAFNSGMSYWGGNLTAAVLNGTIPEWRLDDMVTRILTAYYQVGRDTQAVPINFDSWTLDTFGYQNFAASDGYGLINEHVDVRKDHARLIRQVGAESTVLLKNVNNSLPLKGSERLTAVFGSDAAGNPTGPNGCPDRGCDKGTLAMAWGSGSASFPYLITPDTAIQNEVMSHGGVYQSITDNYASLQIKNLAARASVALVFVNSDSGEGYINVEGNIGDRQNLTLWNSGDDLVQMVSSICNNTIVVIHSTGPVLIGNYSENANITAILWAGIPGQESGNSITDVLYGRVNPGAKLPFTVGRTRADYGTDVLYKPNNDAAAPQQAFTEGVFIDYRSFNQRNITPVYEFGFGLSYTNFSYADLKVIPHEAGVNGQYSPTTGQFPPVPVSNQTAPQTSDLSQYNNPGTFRRISGYIYPYLDNYTTPFPATSASAATFPESTDNPKAPVLERLPASGAPGGNPGLYSVLYTVTASVTNTGSITGAEVPQLYVSLGGAYDPPKMLRGFEKLSVGSGATVTFSVDLTRRDLSRWDVDSQNWVLVPELAAGKVRVFVGSSSEKLPLQAVLK